jgi:hypothetical protein
VSVDNGHTPASGGAQLYPSLSIITYLTPVGLVSRMQRLYAAGLVAVLLVLAGCSGGPTTTAADGPDATTAAPTVPTTTDPGTPDDPRNDSGLSGTHPAVSDGQLNATRLLRGHIEAFRPLASFTVQDSSVVRHAGNESLVVTEAERRRFNISAQRVLVERRLTLPNGTVRNQQVRYTNETLTCAVGETTECSSGGFNPSEALQATTVDTSLATVPAPRFVPNGTTTVNGTDAYRYTADRLRDSIPAPAQAPLGEDPALRSATLFVSESGQILRYQAVYEGTIDGERYLTTATYGVTAIGETTVPSPLSE